MQSIARTFARAPVQGRFLVAARPFHQTTFRPRHREEHQQDPSEVEQAKQEQLRDGKKKEVLQSNSEAGVHADRENVKDHDSHIEKLQKETAQQAEKK